MNMKKYIITLLYILISLSANSQQSFDFDNIRSHPRLLLTSGEEKAIHKAIENNESLALVHKRIMDVCVQTLNEDPVTRVMEGKRLLAKSRIALKRIYYLSYAYRMTGESKYAKRAEEEMLAVCRFTDWNPSHFLDVGEMTMGLAIGYDWLYHYLSEDTKIKVREAIEEKAFLAAENKKHAWFYNTSNNWNSVCNSGLIYGALAIYDESPEIAKEIIAKGMLTNPKSMNSYGPDGGYPEGFGYWGYGTSFQVMLIAGLQSALGTDMGLSCFPGFMQSAKFMQYMTAPSGQSFCFSDTSLKVESNMMMFWFAQKSRDLSLLWLEKEYIANKKTIFAEDRLLPCLMIFTAYMDINQIKAPDRKTWFNRGETPVFIYRGGWESTNDTYLGVKGGSPKTPHAHMDAGSFIYERAGVRWAMDLGAQSYITLESKGVDLWNMSQNGQRWDVFRLNNKSHNTLTINNERHLVDSYAPITKFYESDEMKGAEVDLSTTFANSVSKAIRNVYVDKDDNLTVTDNITTKNIDTNVMWVMVTPAEAKITGNNSIILTKDGKRMLLKVTSSESINMKIWSNTPSNDYDAPNPGTIRVGFEANIKNPKETLLKVELVLLED